MYVQNMKQGELPRGNTQTITSTYRASSVVARVNFTVILMPSKQILCDPPSALLARLR